MSIEALSYADEMVTTLATEEELAEALRREQGLLWVHVKRTSLDDIEQLGRLLPFHPLALQDCLNPRYQRPKVDEFPEHLFVLLHGIDHAATDELVVTTELDMFVSERYVVTSSLVDMPAIDQLFEQSREDGRLFARGTPMLAHAIIGALIDSVLPTIDVMGDFADAVEERALESPHPNLLQAILRLKRSALRIHRVITPERDIANRLSRGDYALFGPDTAIYFRDVYDHIVRIEDLTQTLRERADNALTTYLSAVGIRQNETMRVLSIVASVFLPLTLLAGIYGMNFENMPELGWRWGYFVVLGVMVTVTGGVVWWFWARRLIDVGRQQLTHVLSFRVDADLLHAAIEDADRIRRRSLEITRLNRS